MTDFKKRITGTPHSQPDSRDQNTIDRISKRSDTAEGITLAEMDLLRDEQYNGKISLRVPKSMHRDLMQAAKEEGISLNQFILYKLAK